MKIIRQAHDSDSDKWRDWHILTVAESGFSTLAFYGQEIHGLDSERISNSADLVNSRDEPGSLFPEVPVSALPKRFFRDIPEADIPNHLTRFKRLLKDFLLAKRARVHANKLLIDFHVSAAPVSEPYLAAVEAVHIPHQGKSIKILCNYSGVRNIIVHGDFATDDEILYLILSPTDRNTVGFSCVGGMKNEIEESMKVFHTPGSPKNIQTEKLGYVGLKKYIAN